jgi:hypothetical protein
MNKINIRIDVLKVPKDRIVERRYKDKNNHEVICKDLKLEVVPLREPKLIKEGADWAMYKTHFVALEQTKEQREAKEKSVIIGDGISFLKKGDDVSKQEHEDLAKADSFDASSIPF